MTTNNYFRLTFRTQKLLKTNFALIWGTVIFDILNSNPRAFTIPSIRILATNLYLLSIPTEYLISYFGWFVAFSC